MLKSKAVDILKTFSKEEFRRFEYFAESPYFNRNNSLTRFVKALKGFYPAFSSEKMTEEYLYGKVFGEDKFSYSSMRNLMSEMLSLCETFLITDRSNKEDHTRARNALDLLEEFRERHLDKLFDIRSKRFEEELKKHSIQNSEYFTLSFQLEILKYQYHLEKHSHTKLIWQGFLKRSTFELCNIIQKLHIATDMLIQSEDELRGKASESVMLNFVKRFELENFLKDLKPLNSEEKFYLYFYTKLILLTINDRKDISENYYFEIKDMLKNNLKLFSNYDLYDILKSLRSYTITRMQLFRKGFIDELYETDKLLVEEVDYSSIRLSWFIGEIFTEIVFLSSYKKEYEYAENFIEQFKSKLNDDIREYEYNWTRAFLNIEYGNIEKAIELLSVIKPVNPNTKISTKSLYLRIYYELGYFEEGFSILDAYKHFVNKENKFSQRKKKYYNDQHSLFLRLYKFRLEPQRYTGLDLKKLKEDISKFYFIAGQDWYHKKADELKLLIK
ncbi:MAG: hypothetical protein ABI792_09370 [bacterium]